MTRLGSCLRCGACCKWAGAFRITATQDCLDWLRMRDKRMRVTVLEEADTSGLLLIDVLVPHKCQHLKIGFDGLHSCALGQDNKPQLCKDGPEPETREEGCGFTFVV